MRLARLARLAPIAGALVAGALAAVSVAACAAGGPSPAALTGDSRRDSAATRTIAYAATDEDIANPERGFFEQRFGLLPAHSRRTRGLAASAMRRDREARALTLVRLIYSLDDYRGRDFDAAFLQTLDADFAKARAAGVKYVLRFAYNYEPEPDAPLAQVLRHLDQLGPPLRANADVIAFVEAGLIGFWGEGHDSSNGLVDAETWAVNDRTRQVFNKLLAVLPAGRMIAVRYPRQKQQYAGPAPIGPATAFDGSRLARVGHFDDCFQAGPTNWGTYDRGDPEAFKAYLAQNNLYAPQGGETCNAGNGTDSAGAYNAYNDARPYITCARSTADLARLRYAALHIAYEENVLTGWRREGCFDEIKRRLGYRYRLTRATLPERARPGGAFALSFTVANDGWGALYNPRPVQVVLRSAATGRLYRADAGIDPRRWTPGAESTVRVAAGLPNDLPAGRYDVLLALPDADPRLAGNPAYSVRLANRDTWEPRTGLNVLWRGLAVAPGAGGADYRGATVFR